MAREPCTAAQGLKDWRLNSLRAPKSHQHVGDKTASSMRIIGLHKLLDRE